MVETSLIQKGTPLLQVKLLNSVHVIHLPVGGADSPAAALVIVERSENNKTIPTLHTLICVGLYISL